MKFFKSFLTVLAASSTFGLVIPTKRQEPLDMKCQEAIVKYTNEYKDCKNKVASYRNEEELKNFCAKMNTDKCQKFYTTSLTTIPECKSSDQNQKSYIALLDVALKEGLSQIKIGCATDEQGNFCPLTKIRFSDAMTEQKEQEVFDIAVKESCKSKKCSDIFISSIENLEKISDELIGTISNIKDYPKDKLDQLKKELDDDLKDINEDPTISKALKYLKSAECAAEANSNLATEAKTEVKTDGTIDTKIGAKTDAKTDEESGAITSMTYSSALLVTLALLFTL